MNKRLFGRIAYLITWPGIFLILLTSQRSRVLVVCGDEVLLIRSWLGDGSWQMVGGGINRGEEPAVGACREIFEETGIQAEPADLQFLFKAWTPLSHPFRYRYYAYVLKLSRKPALKLEPHEVMDAKWFSLNDVQSWSRRTLKQTIDAWQSKR